MKTRLELLRDEKVQDDPDFAEALIGEDDIEEDLLDEILGLDDQDEDDKEIAPQAIDRKQLKEEIDVLAGAQSIAKLYSYIILAGILFTYRPQIKAHHFEIVPVMRNRSRIMPEVKINLGFGSQSVFPVHVANQLKTAVGRNAGISIKNNV